ncbi:ADP-dependent NAD(P)H-hydrate dehydratase [Microbacterium sp. P5_E9]
MAGLWIPEDTARALRKPTAADDKYSRGVLGIRTGSTEYPGAAVLGVEAAWRTGLGMVRYLGAARDLVLQRRPETVTINGRVQAWLIGSGTDAATRPATETAALRDLLAGDLPVVVDAGALALAVGATARRIVTPHDREHERLRRELGLAPTGADRVQAARETAAALGAVIVLKGARTIVADPHGWATAVESGTPWLATAGTGDVLAGAIGALVAGAAADDPAIDEHGLARVAAAAVWLHGRAGALASAAQGGGPITALDVAEALPRAVAEALAIA